MNVTAEIKKSIAEQLRKKGAVDHQGRFNANVEFIRNPVLDRVSIPHVGRKGATSVSVDSYIAASMVELLGSRMAYIWWVRAAVRYIVEQSGDIGITGSAGVSRLVQREAVGYIKKNIRN